jgi:hypothetical protein
MDEMMIEEEKLKFMNFFLFRAKAPDAVYVNFFSLVLHTQTFIKFSIQI